MNPAPGVTAALWSGIPSRFSATTERARSTLSQAAGWEGTAIDTKFACRDFGTIITSTRTITPIFWRDLKTCCGIEFVTLHRAGSAELQDIAGGNDSDPLAPLSQ